MVIGDNTNGIYNLCSGNQYNLKEVIHTICELMNNFDTITFNTKISRNLTSPIICGYNHKIKKYSKITKLTELTDGLNKTINYYKNER